MQAEEKAGKGKFVIGALISCACEYLLQSIV